VCLESGLCPSFYNFSIRFRNFADGSPHSINISYSKTSKEINGLRGIQKIYNIDVLMVDIEFVWRGLENKGKTNFSESFHPFRGEPDYQIPATYWLPKLYRTLSNFALYQPLFNSTQLSSSN